MSTKIFNAFKFNGKPFELMELCKNYRLKWHDFQIGRIYDHISQSPTENDLKSYSILQERIEKESTENYPSWADSYDVRGSVVVYFHKNNTYVQSFLPKYLGMPEFFNDRFEDFHYQNQTDPWYDYEENMSLADKKKAARNWKLRKKVWNEILGEFSTPAETGLVYEMCAFSDSCKIAMKVAEKFRNEKI